MKKCILSVSVTLNLFIFLFFVGKRIYYSSGAAGESHSQPGNDSIVTLTYNKYRSFDSKRRMYALLPINKTDVLFIGDSMTEQYPLNEIFSTLHIKNRGISGSSSADVLKTANQFNIPNTVFLLVGVNDFFYKVPMDSTVKHIAAAVNLFHEKNSKSKVYVQSVLPVADKPFTQKAAILDQRLLEVCKTHNATFINLFPHFLSSGTINKNYTIDGVHLSPEGYKVWSTQIRKFLPTNVL